VLHAVHGELLSSMLQSYPRAGIAPLARWAGAGGFCAVRAGLRDEAAGLRRPGTKRRTRTLAACAQHAAPHTLPTQQGRSAPSAAIATARPRPTMRDDHTKKKLKAAFGSPTEGMGMLNPIIKLAAIALAGAALATSPAIAQVKLPSTLTMTAYDT